MLKFEFRIIGHKKQIKRKAISLRNIVKYFLSIDASHFTKGILANFNKKSGFNIYCQNIFVTLAYPFFLFVFMDCQYMNSCNFV